MASSGQSEESSVHRVTPREALDESMAGGCSNPECGGCASDTMFLRARCHLDAGVQVIYHSTNGVMAVECAECGSHVVAVLVAAAGQFPGAGSA